ncbi:hypothetical protein COMA2_20096 [Candidatus Nitrospira nitrificans]|uniref:Uncharacterized protein n=1 Tax=Candidatus Nitrospira nitrificans TaxID=1742973 RepID=A0A0S4LD36_9BACT|nr:hypothetical protein COMA2_20096 [Candidatus Nitrospira nitrificans]
MPRIRGQIRIWSLRFVCLPAVGTPGCYCGAKQASKEESNEPRFASHGVPHLLHIQPCQFQARSQLLDLIKQIKHHCGRIETGIKIPLQTEYSAGTGEIRRAESPERDLRTLRLQHPYSHQFDDPLRLRTARSRQLLNRQYPLVTDHASC